MSAIDYGPLIASDTYIEEPEESFRSAPAPTSKWKKLLFRGSLMIGLVVGVVVVSTSRMNDGYGASDDSVAFKAFETPDVSSYTEKAMCEPVDLELTSQFNNYRVANRAPRMPVSSTLIQIARMHAFDGNPQTVDGCNLNSWGRDRTNANRWSPCCYPSLTLNDWYAENIGNPNIFDLMTEFTSQMSCMTDKAMELTNRQFDQIAYETSAVASSADQAFQAMARNSEYRRRMLDTGTCSLMSMRTVGCSSAPIGGGQSVYHCWFSSRLDSRDSCPNAKASFDAAIEEYRSLPIDLDCTQA